MAMWLLGKKKKLRKLKMPGEDAHASQKRDIGIGRKVGARVLR